MGALVPTKVFLVRGCGRHKEKLVSFEKALREMGIAPFNLVRVSSIYPPHCRLVTKAAGLKLLQPGQILFVVLSENATDDPREVITASIGMAVPDDPSQYGYLAEHSDYREVRQGDGTPHGVPGRRDAGDQARREAQGTPAGEARGVVPHVERPVAQDAEHHPERDGRGGPVDDGHGGRRPYLLKPSGSGLTILT